MGNSTNKYKLHISISLTTTSSLENNCSTDPSSCPVKNDLLNATKPAKVWLTPTDDITVDAVVSLTKEIAEKFHDVH